MTAYDWMRWAMYFLDCTFFVGIAGCAAVVVFSWVSILKDGLSEDK